MADHWRVAVDQHACIASGMCRGLAPEVFTEGPSGKTVVKRDLTAPGERILGAAATCPAEAITVTDAGTGERLAPT